MTFFYTLTWRIVHYANGRAPLKTLASVARSGYVESHMVPAGEQQHRAGLEGLQEAKLWLESTTRFDVHWTAWGQGANVPYVTVTQINGKPESFERDGARSGQACPGAGRRRLSRVRVQAEDEGPDDGRGRLQEGDARPLFHRARVEVRADRQYLAMAEVPRRPRQLARGLLTSCEQAALVSRRHAPEARSGAVKGAVAE